MTMAGMGILLAAAAGIFGGIITGLTPGIHVNLVAVLVVSLAGAASSFIPLPALAVFIISLALTHSFLDAIPSIYLGAPDEAQALNVLPGHRLLHKGLGHTAVAYTVLGSLGALVLGLVLFPLFIYSMGIIFPIVKGVIGYILALIMAFMITRERKKWLPSLVAFLMSGTLGLLVLTALPNLRQPLLPLLSGLFGVSILLTSLLQKSRIPPQNAAAPLTIRSGILGRSVSAATGMGFIAAFLPGFGNAQAAIIATNIVGDVGDEGFLTLVGGINTANMLLSIGTVYALDKARNGAIVAVKELLGTVGFREMLLFLLVALAVGGIAALLTLGLSRIFARHIAKLPYTELVLSIIGFIAALSFIFDGIIGLLILITATALGLLASAWGVGKNHLMGCLIVPVILFFVL